MSFDFQLRGEIGEIVLDRPPANSYDLAAMTEFAAAVDAAIASGSRVAVVRSANEKFFSAGADIKRFIEGDVEANMEMIRVSQEAFGRMEAAPVAFVALIEGHALGGGLEIALACDLRVAVEGEYKLGTPEVNLGLLPGNGGTQRLCRLLGRSIATDLLLTGRTIMPARAAQIGLVNDLVPAAEGAWQLAERFAAGAPLAVGAIKRLVREGSELPLEEALLREAAGIEALFGTADAVAGLSAFAERREPRFEGA